jgi:hypothetical protein
VPLSFLASSTLESRDVKAATHGLGFFACLYLLEASCLVAAAALHQSSEESVSALVAGRFGPFFLAGLCGAAGLAVYLIRRYRTAGAAQQHQMALTVAINLTSVLMAFGFGEAVVRVLATQTPEGPTFLDTLLLPRSWNEERARYRDLLKQTPASTSYLVPDELLGWTVGPNREAGVYSSSSEGIRSAAPSKRYADRQPQYRIATVGDSFTFALGVPFEASWPNRLEQQLGSTVQVLNFGVAAYGVDQAYLRYLRDVRPWHPDVVVLGLIQPDFFRSLAVYSFVSYPRWAWPFAKPRLVVDAAGRVRALNVPVPSPQEILSVNAITDLPFIEYDLGFHPMEWGWRTYHHSYLVRFVLSRFRGSPEERDRTSTEAIALNAAIIASFARLAEGEGSTPVVVYFPSRSDFPESRREKAAVLTLLREQGIRYEDLTSCVGKLGVSELFSEDSRHYSAKGNERVSTCLYPLLRDYLSRERRAARGGT